MGKIVGRNPASQQPGIMLFSPRAMRLEGRKMRQLVREIVPPEDLEYNVVGCTGSAVVAWCTMSYHWDQLDKIGWADWKPNDLDILVCGLYGSSKPEFEWYVEMVLERIHQKQYVVEEVKIYVNRYVLKNMDVHIADVKLAGFGTTLSFIQCPVSKTVMDAVKLFDFDIVQVVYNFKQCSYQFPSQEAIDNLTAGKMDLSEEIQAMLLQPSRSSSPFNVKKLKSTYARILKYRARGFTLDWFCVWKEKFSLYFERWDSDYDSDEFWNRHW